MRARRSKRPTTGAGLSLCLIAGLLGFAVYSQRAGADSYLASSERFPLEISPEGVRSLAAANIPFILINADGPNGKQITARSIYYTSGPSSRPAQTVVAESRRTRAAASSEAISVTSQRLTGTPLDWQRLGLRFDRSPLPTQPGLLTPKQLAESIKDGVDLQIVDLRAPSAGAENSPFPQVLRLLPHQLEGEPSMLSKQRWIVLIDGGNRVAQPIAERLFRQGHLLTTVLQGGYPAWVEATDR